MYEHLKPDSELWVVPVEYLDDFKGNPDMSEREHGARCSRKLSKFVKEPDLIDIYSDREAPTDENNILKPWFIGIPEIIYYVHIDLGKSDDCLGFCMGHQEGVKTVIDLAEDWPPEKHGGDIFFEDVRTRLRVLRDVRGFNISLVTYDSWQSYDSIQLLDKIYGFDCKLFSVDRDLKAATQWLWAVNMGLLDIYDVPKYRREAKDLILIGGKKVDHPKRASDGSKGSKDIWDAVAAVTYHCRMDSPGYLSGEDVVIV